MNVVWQMLAGASIYVAITYNIMYHSTMHMYVRI